MPENEEFRNEPIEDFTEDEDAADLPERDALSLIDPTSLLGGTGGGLPLGGTTGSTTPTTPTTTPPTTAPAMPSSPIPMPQMPNIPHDNPGGTYNPDATSTAAPET